MILEIETIEGLAIVETERVGTIIVKEKTYYGADGNRRSIKWCTEVHFNSYNGIVNDLWFENKEQATNAARQLSNSMPQDNKKIGNVSKPRDSYIQGFKDGCEYTLKLKDN